MIRHQRPGSTQPSQAQGRLLARPAQPSGTPVVGLQPLGLGRNRDGLLYVPPSYQPDRPTPLVLMLHGAGGTARQGLSPFLEAADSAGLILLAVDSREPTWDVIVYRYGADVTFIDRALAHVFSNYSIDPTHVAIEGFSDGASYALSLGLINGDLFTHIIAFSPGFIAPMSRAGEPRVFICHGTADQVLPIDACSRRIVPKLQQADYDLQYREFEGGHTIPEPLIREAIDWFAL